MTRRADCFMNSCFVIEQSPEQAEEREAEIIGIRPESNAISAISLIINAPIQRAYDELLRRKRERRLAEFGFESQNGPGAQMPRYTPSLCSRRSKSLRAPHRRLIPASLKVDHKSRNIS
jgi:hypothetical protein